MSNPNLNMVGASSGFAACLEPMVFDGFQDTVSYVRGK